MTRDDIIKLAREAGLNSIYSACDEPDVSYAYEDWDEELEKFAALVAAAEREACAYRASIALLGADRGLSNRVDQSIRAKGQSCLK
jgi:hypothetical protein